MSWISPPVTRPEGLLAAAEPEMLRGVLDWHRATLLHKCAGLTAEQLASTPLDRSNLSLLGLIRHLSKVERIWFRRRFRSEPVDTLYSTRQQPDADFELLDPGRAEAEYARLVEEQELARQAVGDASLDARFVHPSGEEMSLRMVFVHMIGEYARHNGHADLIRQYVDGATGY